MPENMVLEIPCSIIVKCICPKTFFAELSASWFPFGLDFCQMQCYPHWTYLGRFTSLYFCLEYFEVVFYCCFQLLHCFCWQLPFYSLLQALVNLLPYFLSNYRQNRPKFLLVSKLYILSLHNCGTLAHRKACVYTGSIFFIFGLLSPSFYVNVLSISVPGREKSFSITTAQGF